MKRRSLVLLLVVFLLAAAGSVWFLSRGERPRPDAGSDAEGDALGASDLAAPGARVGGAVADDPSAASELSVKIPLDATLTVRVVAQASRQPVAGAQVRAAIDLRRRSDGKPLPFELHRVATTDAKGIAVFDHVPRRWGFSVRVVADGFRVGAAEVTLAKVEMAKTVELALDAGLSPAQAGVQVVTEGDLPAGTVVSWWNDATSASDQMPVGGYVPIDDAPDGIVERPLRLQLLGPGWAGPVVSGTYRRGSTVTLAPPPAPAVQELVFVDERGAGIEGVGVRVWPSDSIVSRRAESLATAVTDVRGVVRIEGRAGTTWEVEVDSARIHPLDPLGRLRPVVGSPPVTIRCLRRVPFRFLLDVPPPVPVSVAVDLAWASFEPPPGSPISAAFDAAEVGRSWALADHFESLRTGASGVAKGAGSIPASRPLVPGTYTVRLGAEHFVSQVLTFQVPTGGGEVRVAMVRARRVELAITGSADRADGPLPYGVIVVPRRVDWDERAEIVAGYGRTSAGDMADVPARGARINPHSATLRAQGLGLTRVQFPWIDTDVAFCGHDGVTEVEVGDDPTVATVIYPDHRAALVRVEGSGDRFRARLEPSAFRAVEVRLTTPASAPASGASFQPALFRNLRRSVSTSRLPSLDAPRDGVLRFGVLDGETIGFQGYRDPWTVTASGVRLEEVTAGDYRGFLATPVPGAVPVVTIVVGGR